MRTLDIPQANDLRTVRRVVLAVASEAPDLNAIEAWTDYSPRHARYRLEAARILGLVNVDASQQATVTPLGERLLACEAESPEARALWRDAITFSRPLQIIAPDLLAPRGPDLEELTTRLVEMSELSESTARHRAQGLLAWRRFALDLPEIEAEAEAEARRPAEAPAEGPDPRQLDLFG